MLFFLFSCLWMDYLGHQKYKSKRLENNFKEISISVNDMDKFGKKRTNKEENIYIKHLV